MARNIKITRGRFMREYRKYDTMAEISAALDVTVPTVHNYCKKYEMPIKQRAMKLKLSLDLFEAFKEEVTLSNLAEMFGVSRQMVRFNLNKGIHHHWVTEKTYPHLPKPQDLHEIRIVHLLQLSPEIENDSMLLGELTKTTLYKVEQYLGRLHELKTKKKKSKKKAKRKAKK